MGGLTDWWIFIKEGREKVKIFKFFIHFLYKFWDIIKVEYSYKRRMNDVVLVSTIWAMSGH